VQILERPGGDDTGTVLYKLRSWGRGDSLGAIFEALNEEMPEARFGGRATAGGSKAIAPCVDAVTRIVRRVLDGENR